MPEVRIYNKEKKKWLTADEIDDLLGSCLLPEEFEWKIKEVSIFKCRICGTKYPHSASSDSDVSICKWCSGDWV